MKSSGKKIHISNLNHSTLRKLQSVNSFRFTCVRACERAYVTLCPRVYSCFVRVCVCTFVRGYDIEPKTKENRGLKTFMTNKM